MEKEEETKKEEPSDREENTINEEEADKLEKEGKKEKKGILEKIGLKRKKKEEKSKKAIPEELEASQLSQLLDKQNDKIDSVVIDHEKLAGKVDALFSFRTDSEERISRLTEELGELRSIIMDRERSFGNIETEFEKIKESTKEIDPTRIARNLEKKEVKIAKNNALIERNQGLIKKLSKELAEFRKTMGRIKSFENLLTMGKELKETVSNINKTKRYTDRIASKTEHMFSEMNKRIISLGKERDKIEKTDELTTELVKTVDGIQPKIENIAKKDDLEKLRDSIKKKEIKELRDSLKTQIRNLDVPKGLKDRIDKLDKLIKTVRYESITDLMEERRNIVALIRNIKKQYEEDSISETSYKEILEKNQGRLEDINAILGRVTKEKIFAELEEHKKAIEELSHPKEDYKTNKKKGKTTLTTTPKKQKAKKSKASNKTISKQVKK